MFGPTCGGVFDAAMLTTRVEIGPGMVVTDSDTADAIVLVVSAVRGAAAVALKYATLVEVVLTGTNDSTPPVLLEVRVIVESPFENLAL